jgi:hypothetical protein
MSFVLVDPNPCVLAVRHARCDNITLDFALCAMLSKRAEILKMTQR